LTPVSAATLAASALGAGGDGDHLPGDGAAVLQAGGANLAGRQAEAARHLADEILGPQVALLDPQVQEVALAARLVGGDLLDLEVLRLGLDPAADAGQVGRQQGRRRERVEGHGRSGFGCRH
jgi:hypothetical protein